MFSSFSMSVFEGLAVGLIVAVGVIIALVAVIFVLDRTQTHDAIRRNYPVVGRVRSMFTAVGEFFRQYFFAMDREELPFNRAQRDWVGRAASGKSNTVAFGSTRNLNVPGTPIFVNAPFPPLDDQFAKTDRIVMGNAFRCHNELGRLCEEKNYERDLASRLARLGFDRVLTQVPVIVRFESFERTYRLDLVVDNLIYELKTVEPPRGFHGFCINQLIGFGIIERLLETVKQAR